MNSKSSIDSFFPQDPVSEELLKSIPKKVYNWLDGLGEDLTCPGSYQTLSWEFNVDDTSHISVDVDGDAITLWWEGDAHNTSSLCSNSRKLEDIPNNIEFFTQLEEEFYSTLESFEEERDR